GSQKIQYAKESETIADVAARMSSLGISQMPLQLGSDLKIVHETDLLRALVSGQQKGEDSILTIAETLRGRVSLDDSIDVLGPIFAEGNTAVVIDKGKIVSLLSKIDLVKFLSAGNKTLPSY